MEKLRRIGSAIDNWLCVNSVIFLGWGFLSYIEIISKNSYLNPIYSNWNLFTLILR